jgi:hypothetical protein
LPLKPKVKRNNFEHGVSPSSKQRDFDVFNCLDLMDNAAFLKELKFGIGRSCVLVDP